MANFQLITQFKQNGEKSIKGYRVSFQKTEIEKAGFKPTDELEIEYKKETIIITKKKD